jgi:hypothetical protein
LIQGAHVPCCCAEPKLPPRHSAAGEFRDGAKLKNRTLANLSDWPAEWIETLEVALRGVKVRNFASIAVQRERSQISNR